MSVLAIEIARGGITGTDAEIVAVLDGKVPMYSDPIPFDWARLIGRLIGLGVAEDAAIGLRDTLEQLPNGPLLNRMIDKGVVLSEDLPRTLIGKVRFGQAKTIQDLLDKVLECGIKQVPLWQKIGLAQLPTVEDVAASLKEIEAREWAAHVRGLLHESLLDGASVEALKDALSKVTVESLRGE